MSEPQWPTQWFDLPLTVFDLETTGFDPHACQIIEIGMVQFYRGQCEKSYNWLVDPQCRIPDEIVKLTHIEQSDVDGQPTFRDIAQDVLSVFDGRGIVAYNIDFDRTFLKTKLQALGLSWPAANPWFDPLIFAQHFYPGQRNKLGLVAERLGVSLEGAHRACNDAEATGYVFYSLLEKFKRELPSTLKELTEVQAQFQIEYQQKLEFRRKNNSLLGESIAPAGPKTLTVAFAYGNDEPDPLRAHYKNVPNKKREN